MTPTPRTDAKLPMIAENPIIGKWELQAVPADFARQLEREAADLKQALEIANRSADDQMRQKREAERVLAKANERELKHVETAERLAVEAETLKEQLTASHAREQQLREALGEINGHLYNQQDLSRCRDLAGAALSLPPPPVVSKEDHDKALADHDRLQKEVYDLENAVSELNARLADRVEAHLQKSAKDLDRLRKVEKIAKGLAESVKCPDCDDVGWYSHMHMTTSGEPEPEQVECQFCKLAPNSRFNAIAAYEAYKQSEGVQL